MPAPWADRKSEKYLFSVKDLNFKAMYKKMINYLRIYNKVCNYLKICFSLRNTCFSRCPILSVYIILAFCLFYK